jgi:hypothetical protein
VRPLFTSATRAHEQIENGRDYSLRGVAPSRNWITTVGYADETVGHLYIASLYWSFTTLATVGYGDIHPVTSSEQVDRQLCCVGWPVMGTRRVGGGSRLLGVTLSTHAHLALGWLVLGAGGRERAHLSMTISTSSPCCVCVCFSPVCLLSQVFAVAVMAVGAVIYSTLFGSMSALISAVNANESRYWAAPCAVLPPLFFFRDHRCQPFAVPCPVVLDCTGIERRWKL